MVSLHAGMSEVRRK